ncbi:hypothetical protein D9M70_454310 [compost metagenome]
MQRLGSEAAGHQQAGQLGQVAPHLARGGTRQFTAAFEQVGVDLAGGENGVEVSAVLVGQNTDREQRVRQADALAVRNLRSRDDRGHDALAVGLLSAQMQLAVVDQQAMAGLDRFEDFRVRQVDARVVAGHVLVVEREGLADLEIHLAFCELADAQLRALKIGENADRPTTVAFHRADALNQRAHHVVARMAHVDTEQISPGLVQLLDHLLIGRRRSERGEDFDFSVPLHQFWLSCVPGVSES